MADGLHYIYNPNPAPAEYSQPYSYVAQQPVSDTPPMSPYYQPEQCQRKRPKYTRSKTGCLTCRAKKVKCDEEKPQCARCRGGSRECVWPDSTTSRKRSSRRDTTLSQSPSVDTRPSTAESPGPSEMSTPPSQHHTMPKAEPVEYRLPRALSRRTADINYEDVQHGYERSYGDPQSSSVPSIQGYTVPDTSSSVPTSAVPEPQYYPTHHHSQVRSQAIPVNHYHHQPQPFLHAPQPLPPQPQYQIHHQHVKFEQDQQWQAAVSQHVDPIHPYAYPAMQDYYSSRMPVGQAPQNMSYPYENVKYQ
ncbi:hypothetical protein BC835DRAFT_1414869 [Cytidiella melzeri]|nr:hypothetical protein BC835DRAFT_1414869 [Cytidiella melzeri]